MHTSLSSEQLRPTYTSLLPADSYSYLSPNKARTDVTAGPTLSYGQLYSYSPVSTASTAYVQSVKPADVSITNISSPAKVMQVAETMEVQQQVPKVEYETRMIVVPVLVPVPKTIMETKLVEIQVPKIVKSTEVVQSTRYISIPRPVFEEKRFRVKRPKIVEVEEEVVTIQQAFETRTTFVPRTQYTTQYASASIPTSYSYRYSDAGDASSRMSGYNFMSYIPGGYNVNETTQTQYSATNFPTSYNYRYSDPVDVSSRLSGLNLMSYTSGGYSGGSVNNATPSSSFTYRPAYSFGNSSLYSSLPENRN
uniref:Uncharacterized protein n=1 Tax=Hanusia phi TaxID=3032 RepID=A0A7S0HV67_9CRYP